MRPKAARRLAPAGSVYFFEARGATSALARLWLEPVSDLPQDRNDGFGLALWGVWSE
jgi:CRISPR-associated protein Cmr3